jgi:MoaA/NifB/PqqE/SkfB family radical SAM enzyme
MDFNKIIFDNYPRGRDWKIPITHHCDQPFRVVNIDTQGECYLCQCEAHLPISVGNISEFEHLEDIWNNDIAKQLQQTITDRSYTYCAVQHCGIINQNNTMDRYQIGINIDESCNLACPSCRRSLINHTSGEIYDTRLTKVNHLVSLLNRFDQPTRIVMTGNGDPLASAIMRPLITNFKPTANQTIKLHTNGLLMRKLLPGTDILPHISNFHISIDAASNEVYQQVRSPGNFKILLDNLSWLQDNRPSNSVVTLMFVVSDLNVSDISAFSELCEQYGFRGEYTKLDNWGTFDNFDSHDVSQPEHPLHNSMCEQLGIVKNKSHMVISPMLQKFIQNY